MNVFPPAIDDAAYRVHRHWMSRAIALAQLAGDAGEVPVGALVVDADNNLIAAAEIAESETKTQPPMLKFSPSG